MNFAMKLFNIRIWFIRDCASNNLQFLAENLRSDQVIGMEMKAITNKI